MSAHYLRPHHAGGYWYQRAVPAAFRKAFGRSNIVRYITQMCRREAERLARGYALQDDQDFTALRQLPAEKIAELERIGGVKALPGRVAELRQAINGSGWTREQALESALAAQTENGRQVGRAIVQMHDRVVTELATLEPIALQAAPAPEMSLDGLFAIWVRVKAPKIERKHRATLALFRAHMGDNTDFRAVTVDDVQGWCDHLAQTGHTLTGQTKHLDNLRGLFSAAVPRYRKDNPARGVKPDGRVVKVRRLPFTGAQLATILAKAESTRFGGKRHVEVLWLLRLAVWTGARINELAQLRREDVTTESGVPLIHIREGDGQSVKTGEARKVPLHPSIANAFLAYAKASQREFIFGAFSHDKTNGRAAWLISNFGKFKREVCGIAGDDTTLHSIRHRFVDACRNAGIAEERAKALVGHAGGDVHSRYGQGPGLRQLAADVARLEPFAD